jgi:hypothetical protein
MALPTSRITLRGILPRVLDFVALGPSAQGPPATADSATVILAVKIA